MGAQDRRDGHSHRGSDRARRRERAPRPPGRGPCRGAGGAARGRGRADVDARPAHGARGGRRLRAHAHRRAALRRLRARRLTPARAPREPRPPRRQAPHAQARSGRRRRRRPAARALLHAGLARARAARLRPRPHARRRAVARRGATPGCPRDPRRAARVQGRAGRCPVRGVGGGAQVRRARGAAARRARAAGGGGARPRAGALGGGAARTVMAGLDPLTTLEQIVHEAAGIAGTPHVKVLIVDPQARTLRVGALTGAPVPADFSLALGAGHSGRVAATGEPLFVHDIANDARNVLRERDREAGMVTYLGLPIRSRDRVLGVLSFNTTTPRRYSPAELEYLGSFADLAGIALENARLYDEAQRALADLKAVQQKLVQG